MNRLRASSSSSSHYIEHVNSETDLVEIYKKSNSENAVWAGLVFESSSVDASDLRIHIRINATYVPNTEEVHINKNWQRDMSFLKYSSSGFVALEHSLLRASIATMNSTGICSVLAVHIVCAFALVWLMKYARLFQLLQYPHRFSRDHILHPSSS